jgi:hypothetical protein
MSADRAASVVGDAYREAGLRGIAELYQQFPARLRSKIVKQHAVLWSSLYQELMPEERAKVEEYVITGAPVVCVEEISLYESKLEELEHLYPQRHAQRVKEARNFEPDAAVADIQSFERAHRQLEVITKELLTQARAKVAEQVLREEEVVLFSSDVDFMV